MKEKEYDIVIVGYSMLGNVAALILAHFGMSVAVIEKKELSDILLAKSARIDDEVMLVFEHLGFVEELKSILYPLKGTQIIDKKERVLLEFNQISRSQFAPVWGFYQPELQKILQKKAARHPNITIFSGSEVETFEQTEDSIKDDAEEDTVLIKKGGVDVYITTTNKQNFTKIKAAYLLVCNGQYSHIADFLKIDTSNFNYHSSVLCVDTISKTKILAQPYAQTIYDAEFPVIRITNNDKNQRWEFQIGEEQIREENTADKVRVLLAELSNMDLEVISAFVYNFESKILTQWRNKRVLIAGDAAHIMPPYLGMSLAAGIKDIYNLAWKLKLIKEEILSPSILDTYQVERSPNVNYLIQLNLWIKRLFKSSKLRWIKGLIPIIPKWFLKRSLDTSNQIKVGIIGNAKGAGLPIISPRIITQKGKVQGLNSVLGNNFVIMGLDCNPVDALQPRQIESLAILRAQFIQLTSQKQKFVENGRYTQNLHDKDAQIEQWMKRHNAQFVLIRPDRIVYDFCANSAKLNKCVVGLMQQLPLPKNEAN